MIYVLEVNLELTNLSQLTILMRVVNHLANRLLHIHQHSSKRHSCTKGGKHDFLLSAICKDPIAVFAHRNRDGSTTTIAILGYYIGSMAR